jgi:YidC/Oxa1 family membrane protein insertase
VFDLIATVLAWFYSLVPNYAVAIAMMTILIMLLLTPLTLKSTKSMLELQRIQPEMKRIQQEYRGDRQAMNEALMALYKEHKVNPLGGCLPLLIQAPIWIVMYRVFIGLTNIGADGNFDPSYLDPSTQLYQDLSQTNDMNAFGLNLAESAARALQDSFVTAIPYLILVGIVVVTYFVQQRQITARNKNNPAVNDSPAAAQQQMIMKIFPIFSGIFSFIVPAALAWYFLVQNLFRIGQQAYITKRFYREHPDAIATRQAGSGASSSAKAPKAAGNGTGTADAAKKGARGSPAKSTPPKAKPTPSGSGNGKRRTAPKPPPRSSGSAPKPPVRPRPQKKKP